jgi:hypothetical protein
MMILLSDVGQVEGCFGPFGDSVCNDPKIVTIFHNHLEHEMHLKIVK